MGATRALVICVGQAGGRAEITPERVAINLEEARIPDNAGCRPLDVPVVSGGPAAYWSTLPVGAIVRALKRRGIPAAVSLSAGTFVCNHVFYGLMHELAALRPAPSRPVPRGGFIHIPFLPEQAAKHHDQPSLPLELVVDALAVAVKISLDHKQAVFSNAGAITGSSFVRGTDLSGSRGCATSGFSAWWRNVSCPGRGRQQ